MFPFLVLLIAVGGYVVSEEAPELLEPVKEVISIEKNAETGLTDFTIAGKELGSLEITPLDYSKLND
jgi:hypothetical protein